MTHRWRTGQVSHRTNGKLGSGNGCEHLYEYIFLLLSHRLFPHSSREITVSKSKSLTCVQPTKKRDTCGHGGHSHWSRKGVHQKVTHPLGHCCSQHFPECLWVFKDLIIVTGTSSGTRGRVSHPPKSSHQVGLSGGPSHPPSAWWAHVYVLRLSYHGLWFEAVWCTN